MRGTAPVTLAIALATTAAVFAVVGASRSAAPAGGVAAQAQARPQPSAAAVRAAATLAREPVAFVENRGQADSRVRFAAQGDGFAFFATPGELRLALDRPPSSRLALGLRFLGGDPAAEPVGSGRLQGDVNYLTGDAATTHTNVPRYAGVRYPGLWPGVDLGVRAEGGVLKYEFLVHPGGRPDAIRLAYAGADGLSVGGDGSLAIATEMGTLRDAAPTSYQERDGVRTPVASGYALGHDGQFSFRLGAYRGDRDLVIDPGIQFTTFLGGSSHEVGNGIAVDAAGNAYVAGTTQSPDFPTTVGAFRRTGSATNNQDIFVTKLNAAGTALVYSTFVGGSKADVGRRIAIDASGNAYVAGQTTSSNFPTSAGAFDRTLAIPPNCPRCAGADNYDGVAFKLNAAGSALTYSTYLGGTDIDSPRGIAVDGNGSAYVIGETLSGDYPTTAGAFRRTRGGEYDEFVTKLNATGSALTYSTFLGGSAVDDGERVAVDAAGSAYVLGFSSSADFPTTPGAADTTANGAFDVTLSKLNPAGSALVYSTFLGGSGFDDGGGLAVDAAGNAYVAGGAGSTDFPTTAGAFDTTSDGGDAFLTKLNPAGSAFVFSTMLGGTSGEGAAGIAVDPAGNAWLTGTTSSTDFPVSADAADGTFNGTSDAFITEVSANGATVPYSTYLGAALGDNGIDIARGPDGDLYATGVTYSQGFPATTGAFDTVFNGDPSIFWGDAFITRLDLARTTSTPPAAPPVPAAPALLAPSNGDTPPQPVTFDWADVPAATTYQIQVDDQSSFTAPLVRDETVSSSVYGTTDLPTTALSWRVRGINSLGQAGAWSAVRTLTPQAPPPPAVLTNLDINPTSIAAGDVSSGTVILSVGAPHGGAVIALSSSNPAVASVPPSVTVPETGFTGGFAISTSAVQATTSVTITASYNGSTRAGTLTVTNGAPPPSSLSNLLVSPSSVQGGNTSQGVVSLTAAAPAGGTIVALSSSDPAAGVPQFVSVAPGATTVVFTITTTSVAASTAAVISATLNGATRTATLTVTPGAAPPPPPPSSATITLTASGRSGVTVTSSPAGLSVVTGGSGSASFASGTRVTLTVGSGRDAIFSGACSSGGQKVKSCAFTVASSASVSASVQ